jgi:hypothetical protein
MNMRKVGIVVQSISLQEKVLTPRQYRAFNMTRYTLCEYQRQAKRNSSRHSFAFYILLIGRIAPVSCRRAAALAAAGGKESGSAISGYVCNTRTNCHGWQCIKTTSSHIPFGLQPDFALKTTIPPLSNHSNGFAACCLSKNRRFS